MHKTYARIALCSLVVALAVVFVGTLFNGADPPTVDAPAKPNASVLQHQPAFDTSPGKGQGPKTAPSRPATVKTAHPLLELAQEAVLAEGNGQIHSTASLELTVVIRAVVQSDQESGQTASLTIDYPHHQTIFPPEIVAPSFLWHEPDERADTWLIDVAFEAYPEHIYILSPGRPPPAGQIDPRCITKTNEIYEPTAYQASAKNWTPHGHLWEEIKRRSAGLAATVSILGFNGAKPAQALSRGRITFTTSKHPVGAPVFYRDVPLAPALTHEGVIKPLGDEAVKLIAWRLRDISKPRSRILLTDVPTCTNCHSFSADGKTLGMDLDGPQGDKGTYVIAPVTRRMVIEEKDVMSWNSFQDKPKNHKTIGFLSRISPDGQYAVTTLNEAVYVRNFLDYKFLQVFFPTRGILGYYSRASGQIKALPGADDPSYVHCDAVWGPDAEYLVFARAQAKDPYTKGRRLAQRANDTAETRIQYDLYRIPFDGGRGGKPEPIAGASNNGLSNSFPKVSPDGKWIVFVKCRNGQLMRPDSRLWIVPAVGGEARLMNCNTRLMNSWHSFSPNGRWMVFSSKSNTPYTQMFLTHIDRDGNDSPAVLIPNSTSANRAVNLPEFINLPYDELLSITAPAIDYLKYGLSGVELAEKGMLDEAMAEFDKAIRLRPDHLQTRVNAAVVLIDKGMLDEAADRLNEVLELDPKNSHAHGSLGVILTRKGMSDEALTQFQTALKLAPDYMEARANLGRALLKAGRLDEAMAHLQAALQLDVENPRGHFDLGNALLAQGMPGKAVERFRKSVEIDPRFVDPRLALGNLLAAQGEFEPALEQLQQAVAIDPNNFEVRLTLGLLLLDTGQLDEAMQHLLEAVRLQPGSALASFYCGSALHRLGRPEEALSYYRRAVEHNPELLPALLGLASIHIMVDRPELFDLDKALTAAKKACEVTRHEHPDALRILAGVYAMAGQLDDAVNTAARAVKIAREGGAPDLADQIQKMLDAYKQLQADRQE